MLKKSRLIIVGVLATASLLSLVTERVFATSDYGIHTTTSLKLRGAVPAANCGDEEEWAGRWTDFMSTDTADLNSYKNTWNYTSNYDYARSRMDDFHDRFISNVQTGSGWAVQHRAIANGTGQGITIWLFDPSADLTVQNGLLAASTGFVWRETFAYNPGSGCRWQAVEYNTDQWSGYIGVVDEDDPLFFVASDNIVYPTDYSGVQIPSSPPPASKYVALGDSFSSGEGNPPFDAATDIDNTNECHRSDHSYPRLLPTKAYVNLTNFVACSGAKTENITTTGQWNEDPQIEALTQDTDIVSLTIGGNDVGFSEFATACTTSLCDFTTQAYSDIHDSIVNDLPAKLANTYETIDNATSTNTKVYVLGYPYIVPSEMPTGASSACWPFNGGLNNSDPTQNNGAAAYAVETQLNDAIAQAVSDYGSSKFQYVNPNTSSSPFVGHDWCSQSRFFDVVSLPLPWDPNSTVYSYHPNALGQGAYTTIFRDSLQ